MFGLLRRKLIESCDLVLMCRAHCPTCVYAFHFKFSQICTKWWWVGWQEPRADPEHQYVEFQIYIDSLFCLYQKWMLSLGLLICMRALVAPIHATIPFPLKTNGNLRVHRDSNYKVKPASLSLSPLAALQSKQCNLDNHNSKHVRCTWPSVSVHCLTSFTKGLFTKTHN